MDRPWDIIVYGATGFTGKEVCRYLRDEGQDMRWAIAGRSESKLTALIEELRLSEDIATFIASADDHCSLLATFSQGTLLLNCTGPYRFLGEPVVKACIESRTHYMDICGEPQFMENMFLKYHAVAAEAGVLVLHACAFDSVPADLGVLFCMRKFKELHEDTHEVYSIESYLSIHSGPSGIAAHYTTFECAVHGMADVNSLRRIRREINEKYDPPTLNTPEPRLRRKNGIEFDERFDKYVMPFMGADASVVKSSFRSLSLETGVRKFPHYAAYAVVGDWGNMLTTAIVGGVVTSLAPYSFGRSVLLQYPEIFTYGIFSHDGPSREQLEETSFTMDFFVTGRGGDSDNESTRSDKIMRVAVSGPEPGYVATPRIFITLARVLLKEYGKELSGGCSMPRGGVFTPSTAYYFSPNVYDSLAAAGIKFEVCSHAT